MISVLFALEMLLSYFNEDIPDWTLGPALTE